MGEKRLILYKIMKTFSMNVFTLPCPNVNSHKKKNKGSNT